MLGPQLCTVHGWHRGDNILPFGYQDISAYFIADDLGVRDGPFSQLFHNRLWVAGGFELSSLCRLAEWMIYKEGPKVNTGSVSRYSNA